MDITTAEHAFLEYLAVGLFELNSHLRADICHKDGTHIVRYYDSPVPGSNHKYAVSIGLTKLNGVNRVQIMTMETLYSKSTTVSRILTDHSIPVKDLSIKKDNIKVINALLEANFDKISKALSGEEVHWQ